MQRPCQPRAEPLEKYVNRVTAWPKLFGALGQPMDDGALETLIAKADIEPTLAAQTAEPAFRLFPDTETQTLIGETPFVLPHYPVQFRASD